MFIGKANLTNPENAAHVATFHEECESPRQVIVTLSIKPAIKLESGESLAVFAIGNAAPITSLHHSGTGPRSVTGFSGKSTAGCLAAGTEVSLVRNLGGSLGTTLVVLGKGVIHEET
jgi:hypothetical protein